MESYINCEPEKNHNKRTLPSLGTKLTSTRWPAPFYADQERTISQSAQPRLRDKMNPNYHHSDYFDESYQKNWTQAGQIRSSNLQHHSSVHTPFSDQPSPSSGLLTPYSRVPRPYVPQPPAYQYNPTENPSHYGPYYGAPPGTCNFSGYYSTRAPLPSAAATSSDEFEEIKKKHGEGTRIEQENEVLARRWVRTGVESQHGVKVTHGVGRTIPSGNDYRVKVFKDAYHKTDDMAHIKTLVPDRLDNPISNLADSAASQNPGNEPPLKKYDFREASRDLIRQLTISEVRKHVLDNKRGTTFGSVMHILESSKQIDMTAHGHFYVDLIIEMLNSDEFSHINNWIQVINQEERFMREKERRKRKQEEINSSSTTYNVTGSQQENGKHKFEGGQKRKYTGLPYSNSKKYRNY